MIYNRSKCILTAYEKRKQVEDMPLTMAGIGTEMQIKKINGRDETKRFLENLGFIIGGEIMVVSTINGNLIVKVKDSRVAVSKEMAMKIIV